MSGRPAFDLILKNLGRESSEVAWTTGVAILLFSPISVTGNGLVLASILLDPFKNIRVSPSSGLIFSLALVDLLAGVITGPLVAYWLISISTNGAQPFSTNILSSAGTFSVGVSLYSLIALSVDRLIAITTPLQYAHRVTKRRIRIVNVLIWGCCISVGMLIMVSNAFNLVFDIFTVTNYVIASIALVVLNTAVIRSVHKQALNLKRTVISENVLALQNVLHREKAVAQTIYVLVAVFEICICPSIIFYSVVVPMREVTDLYDLKIFLWVYFMSTVLVFANSLVNPFLYAWRLPKYRKTDLDEEIPFYFRRTTPN